MLGVTDRAPQGRAAGADGYVTWALGAILGLSILKAFWDPMDGLEVIDLWSLARSGSSLFGSRWVDVFSDPGIQVGPLTLLIQGGLWEASAATGVDLEIWFSLLVQPAVVVASLWIVGKGIPDRIPRRRAQLVVAAFLLVWEIPWNAYVFGHPTEFLIPILWLWAALLAREGRAGWAGALIAASAGLKLWGVLGFPLLLLLPGIRPTIRGLGAALAGVGLLYGPFLLFGEVRTFEYEWVVGPGTGPAWVLGEGALFGWPPRFLQGALALASGAALTYLCRRRGDALVWAPALGIIGVRLALDPTAFPYYWLAAQSVLLVAAGWLIGRSAAIAAAALLTVALVTFLASSTSVVAVALLAVVTATAAAIWGDRLDLTRFPLRGTTRAG